MGKPEDVEKALTAWFVMTRAHGIPVSNTLLKRKAKGFARKLGYLSFEPSDRWLLCWKKSNAIVTQTEGKQASKSQQNIHGTKSFQKITSELAKNYNPSDVYACKEIGIKWDVLPQEVLVQDGRVNFEDRAQMTVLFATNQCGSDKRQLVVTGEEPVESLPSSLPCEYHMEPHSWITSDIFVDWVIEFDYEMRKQKRRIVLVLDSSPVHPQELQKDLTNIKLIFVDPDNKPEQNPCDCGIAYSLKAHYRREFIMRRILEGEQEMSQLDVFHMLNKAWFVLSSKTVTASFCKAGLHDKAESQQNLEQEQITIEDLSLEDTVKYVDFDKFSKCFGMLVDDNICSKLFGKTKGKDEQSSKNSKAVVVTEDDALRVLATLRRFYETNEMIDFSSFYALETQVLESINRKDT